MPLSKSNIIFLLAILCQCRGELIANEITFSTNSIGLDRETMIEYGITPPVFTIPDMDNFPENCSQRQKRKIQPIHNKNSHLKKCCPIGEGLEMKSDDQNSALCVSTYRNFKVDAINVTLYDNCIEDMESGLSLPFEIGNPCNTSFLYNNADDLFFVMQDGSLLIMDLYANDTYATENKYCIDTENVSGTTFAIVCITAVEEHINRSNIVVVAILMLISIPCLLMVSYVHVRIADLRSLHGIALSIMSGCLATGYFLYSLVHILKMDERGVGYAVQFFILSYYFWFFCLCCNVSFNICNNHHHRHLAEGLHQEILWWIHIPLSVKKTKFITFTYLGSYCGLSFLGALVLVILTNQKGLPGMPSYFIQGYTESIRGSQRYFIPPVSSLLLLSFLVMAGSFFGFQKLKNRGLSVSPKDECVTDTEHVMHIFEEVKKDAKCISLLGIILISTWLLEIVTFYSPGPQIYLILMDMINGLQGVFVLLIFLIIRRRRTVIFRWWNDRGSFIVENIELNISS